MNINLKELSKVRGFLDVEEIKFLNRLAKKTIDRFGVQSALCEIGSFCGKSTIAIASALNESNGGTLYSIDWHQGSLADFCSQKYQSTYEEFLNNLDRFYVRNRVVIIKNKSEDSVEAVPEKLHFLWIDGAHEYDAVKADFNSYSLKLVDGGYLLFHDACWTGFSDPFKVIKEEVLDNPQYSLYACVGNTMVFEKIPNQLSHHKRRVLIGVFDYTSGENRSLPQKVLSYTLFRLATLYTICGHDWRR